MELAICELAGLEIESFPVSWDRRGPELPSARVATEQALTGKEKIDSIVAVDLFHQPVSSPEPHKSSRHQNDSPDDD